MAIRTVLGAAALLAAAAGAASAQSVEAQIRSQLEAQGFGEIEIERDDGRIEVDARRGAQRIDLTYDARTGELLDRASGNARDDDDDQDRPRDDRDDDRDGDRNDDRDDRGEDDGEDGRGGSGGDDNGSGDDDRGEDDDRGGVDDDG